MATATTTKLVTAEEFMAADLGEGSFELVRGEVVEVPPAMPEHGRVCGNAFYLLETYGRQTGLGYALSNDSAVVTE
ncbi:MAG TPA: Uma2 family endonuclease, partial [Isosphaeraceae bacterium]|nr:Uma2 family endonuclease [Isosphaeraceae bacterium]